MVKLTLPQNIPADWLDKYKESLEEARSDGTVRKRYPWNILFHRQGVSKFWNAYVLTSEMKFVNSTLYQEVVRTMFKACVRGFNNQVASGGATPPALGPRDYSWWYNAASGSGLWYYDYFIQQTMDSIIDVDVPPWTFQYMTGDSLVMSEAPDTPGYAGWAVWLGKKVGFEHWYLIKKGPANYNYLAFWITAFEPSPVGWDSVILDCYDLVGGWNYWTVTWNNKPGVGRLISSAKLVNYKPQGFGWIYMLAGPNTDGVLIRVREGVHSEFMHTIWQNNARFKSRWVF